MPNCIQLTRIGSREPSTFQDIDTAICAALDLPWDDTRWVYGWYDIICFMLAMGKSFADVTDHCHAMAAKYTDDDYYLTLLRINHFLLENYINDAWYEVKR